MRLPRTLTAWLQENKSSRPRRYNKTSKNTNIREIQTFGQAAAESTMAQHRYPAWLDEFAQQCPHKHFRTKVVDRDFLTRKQHLQLLCTPRGYRWEVAYQLHGEKSKEKFKQFCEPLNSKVIHPKAYVYNTLAELWSVVTPQMLDRLKAMLMEEFGIKEHDAEEFICKKVQEVMYFADRRRNKNDPELCEDYIDPTPSNQPRLIQLNLLQSQQPCESSLAVKPEYVKNISQAVSKKLAEMMTLSVCAKRTKKHGIMSSFILDGISKITGYHCTMDSAQTKMQKTMTFLADKFALWVLKNIKDEDAECRRKRAMEDAAIRKKNEARAMEKQQREKERIRLAKKLERQNKKIEKAQLEQLADEQYKKQKKQQERQERYAEWQKRDEKNKMDEQRKKKERMDRKKQENAEKAKKEAEVKAQIAKDNEARRKKKEEMLARRRMEERRQQQVKKRDSMQNTKKT